jgi:hypothetical protein
VLDPLYQVLGHAIGACIGYLFAQVVRYAGRSRFWKLVARRAEQFIDDPTVPVVDTREAAALALVEAQRAQLDAIERSIHRGGNGHRLTDDDVTPNHLPPRKRQ